MKLYKQVGSSWLSSCSLAPMHIVELQNKGEIYIGHIKEDWTGLDWTGLVKRGLGNEPTTYKHIFTAVVILKRG